MPSTATYIQFHTKDGFILEASKQAVSYMKLDSLYVDAIYNGQEKVPVNFKAEAFEKVLEYCEIWARYKIGNVSVMNINMYQADFVKFDGPGLQLFFSVLRAADYMKVSPLVDLLSRELAQQLLKTYPETLPAVFTC